MSSSVTTKFGCPSTARRAEVTRTLKVRSAMPRLMVIWLCTARGKSSSASVRQRRDLGHDLGDIGADGRLTLGVVERQFLGRPVEDGDDPVGVDAHDRGRHAGEHGLGELASLVVDPVGFEQPALLKVELGRHIVEDVAEPRQIAMRAVDLDAHVEIAGGNLVGRGDERSNRA